MAKDILSDSDDVFKGNKDVLAGVPDVLSGGTDYLEGSAIVIPTQPLPPLESNYTLPGGGTTVSTVDQLATALNGTTITDIKVNNGTYVRPAAIADMPAPTLAQSATGGTLSDGTYTYLVTALNPQGETMGAVQSITLNGGTATQMVTISWSAHGSGTVNGYRVYGRSGISSALRRLASQPSGVNVTLNDTGTTITSTTAPPTRNSTSGYLRPGAAHRIWCQSVANVTIDFGLMWGNLANYEVHGGTWDISDATKMADDGTGNTGAHVQFVSALNNVRNAKYSDLKIDLHQVGKFGIFSGQPGGLSVDRIYADRCTDEAVYAFSNGPANVAGWIASTIVIDHIWDVNCYRIYRTDRGSADGQHEYGVLIGHPVTNGVKRIRGRDLGWAGLLTDGKVSDTTFEDLDFDNVWGIIPLTSLTSNDKGKVTGQGLYLERTTRRCIFRRCRFGGDSGDIQRGIAMEWDENNNYRLTSTYTIGDAVMNLDYGTPFVVGGTVLPTSGTIYIGDGVDAAVAVTYTGITNSGGTKQLTGCSGGSGGPYATGTIVSSWPGGRQASVDNTFEDIYVNASTNRGPWRPRRGITCDDGTMRPIFRRVEIYGCDDYAFLDNTNVPHAQSDGESNATYESVNLTGINPGVTPFGHPAT